MGFFDQTITPPTSTAEISDCQEYRYVLTRIWDSSRRVVVWIMLNPSTAGARINDATVRKCIRFAKLWGFGGIVIANLFAYRSRDPKKLKRVTHPISEPGDPDRNDRSILESVKEAGRVIVAWGGNGGLMDRDLEVLTLLDGVPLEHLGLTVGGHPGHPLFIPLKTEPMPLPRARRRYR